MSGQKDVAAIIKYKRVLITKKQYLTVGYLWLLQGYKFCENGKTILYYYFRKILITYENVNSDDRNSKRCSNKGDNNNEQ